MEPKVRLGFEIRTLSNLCRREMDNAMAGRNVERLTGMQGRVINYLYHNGDRAVFQRDLESFFSIRRSTATAMLQTMEKHGLVVRVPVAGDARLKRLMLTEKGTRQHEIVEEEIERMERRMLRGISESELGSFLETVHKIKANLGE